MDKIRVSNGGILEGTLPISGAKNAALPLMTACLLSADKLTLHNIPQLADVESLARLLSHIGVKISRDYCGNGPGGDTVHLVADGTIDTLAPYELVRKMRAGFWVLGPLLARFHTAKVSLPGGCAIGTRPVDLYIKTLQQLGATIELDQGYVLAAASGGLRGARIDFAKVSVGATHTAIMAASLAKGESVILNAAREPEVVDLANCLNAMGAKIEGQGSATIQIQGVEALHGTEHTVLPDRIETGTYAMAVGLTGGNVLLKGARAELLEAVWEVLRRAGVEISLQEDGVRVRRDPSVAIRPVDIETAPYPGFPTDLQAQLMALMSRADGVSYIRETIFENRFMHVQELARLGAKIELSGDLATITGVEELNGAPVMATDLRASVSLVMAGMVARGDTVIDRVYHLDRGFERLEEKLRACGGDVERLAS